MPFPASFSFIFIFSKNITIFTTKICEKCPSSIRCWDSNPRHSVHESPPITTRPGQYSLSFCTACVLPICMPTYLLGVGVSAPTSTMRLFFFSLSLSLSLSHSLSLSLSHSLSLSLFESPPMTSVYASTNTPTHIRRYALVRVWKN